MSDFLAQLHKKVDWWILCYRTVQLSHTHTAFAMLGSSSHRQFFILWFCLRNLSSAVNSYNQAQGVGSAKLGQPPYLGAKIDSIMLPVRSCWAECVTSRPAYPQEKKEGLLSHGLEEPVPLGTVVRPWANLSASRGGSKSVSLSHRVHLKLKYKNKYENKMLYQDRPAPPPPTWW